jgi:hypothetical protein
MFVGPNRDDCFQEPKAGSAYATGLSVGRTVKKMPPSKKTVRPYAGCSATHGHYQLSDLAEEKPGIPRARGKQSRTWSVCLVLSVNQGFPL